MEPDEFQRIRSLSPSHWWYQGLVHLARRQRNTKACLEGVTETLFPDEAVYRTTIPPERRLFWKLTRLADVIRRIVGRTN